MQKFNKILAIVSVLAFVVFLVWAFSIPNMNDGERYDNMLIESIYGTPSK